MRSICHSRVIEITFTTEHLSVLLLFLLCCVAVEDCRSNLWCVFFSFRSRILLFFIVLQIFCAKFKASDSVEMDE